MPNVFGDARLKVKTITNAAEVRSQYRSDVSCSIMPDAPHCQRPKLVEVRVIIGIMPVQMSAILRLAIQSFLMFSCMTANVGRNAAIVGLLGYMSACWMRIFFQVPRGLNESDRVVRRYILSLDYDPLPLTFNWRTSGICVSWLQLAVLFEIIGNLFNYAQNVCCNLLVPTVYIKLFFQGNAVNAVAFDRFGSSDSKGNCEHHRHELFWKIVFELVSVFKLDCQHGVLFDFDMPTGVRWRNV